MTSAHVHTGYAHGHNTQVRTASGLNVLAGIWVIISPWVFGYGEHIGAAWNGVIVGIIVVILAAMRFSGAETTWQSWINFILGLWLIISPWLYGYAATNDGLRVDSIIFGIVVAVLALWSAIASRSGATPTPA